VSNPLARFGAARSFLDRTKLAAGTESRCRGIRMLAAVRVPFELRCDEPETLAASLHEGAFRQRAGIAACAVKRHSEQLALVVRDGTAIRRRYLNMPASARSRSPTKSAPKLRRSPKNQSTGATDAPPGTPSPAPILPPLASGKPDPRCETAPPPRHQPHGTSRSTHHQPQTGSRTDPQHAPPQPQPAPRQQPTFPSPAASHLPS
jgi:hypothetical protein